MTPADSPSGLSRTQVVLILTVAVIGFAFDIYELLMLPLIGRTALTELLGNDFSPERVREWVGIIFWTSAVAGGLFGMWGGYLIDKYGRKKILLLSVLIYAFSPLAAAFSTTPMEFLIFRCLTFIGVCVEFVAAVAWLAELFPEPKRREFALGFTQAFSSVGGLLVTGAFALMNAYAKDLPALPVPEGFNGQAPWRYTLITGLLPAIPIMLLLPFLPESPVWQRRKAAGTLKRPSLGAIFAPELRRTTIVSTLLFACAYGAAFGAIQLTPQQIVPGLHEFDEVRAKLKPLQIEQKQLTAKLDAATDPAEKAALVGQIKKNLGQQAGINKGINEVSSGVQFAQEMGGLVGRILLAVLALYVVSKRLLLRIFQIPGVFVVPALYYLTPENDSTFVMVGLSLAAFCTVAQFSYWGNYLPAAFPVHLRGTASGFAANVGGRMIGTSAAFVTTSILAPMMTADNSYMQTCKAAAIVGGGVFVLGLILSFYLPEPKGDAEERADVVPVP